jgi:hypothetical protein
VDYAVHAKIQSFGSWCSKSSLRKSPARLKPICSDNADLSAPRQQCHIEHVVSQHLSLGREDTVKRITYILAAFAAVVATTAAYSQTADTIYTNGKIYTVNEAQPWVEAVAIKDGEFVAVGSDADVKVLAGGETEIVDLGGKFAMPGLHDTHVHMEQAYIADTLGDALLTFPPGASVEEMQELLKAFAEKNPDLEEAVDGEREQDQDHRQDQPDQIVEHEIDQRDPSDPRRRALASSHRHASSTPPVAT